MKNTSLLRDIAVDTVRVYISDVYGGSVAAFEQDQGISFLEAVDRLVVGFRKKLMNDGEK